MSSDDMGISDTKDELCGSEGICTVFVTSKGGYDLNLYPGSYVSELIFNEEYEEAEKIIKTPDVHKINYSNFGMVLLNPVRAAMEKKNVKLFELLIMNKNSKDNYIINKETFDCISSYIGCNDLFETLYEICKKREDFDINCVEWRYEKNIIINTCRFSNNVKSLEFFSKLGVNINHIDKEGNTCIFYTSCEDSKVEMTEFILKNEKFIDNIKNKNLDTPLHIACRDNSPQNVKALIKSGKFDVNALNKDGESPLYISCKKNNWKCVDALFDSDDLIIDSFGKNETVIIVMFSVGGITQPLSIGFFDIFKQNYKPQIRTQLEKKPKKLFEILKVKYDIDDQKSETEMVNQIRFLKIVQRLPLETRERISYNVYGIKK